MLLSSIRKRHTSYVNQSINYNKIKLRIRNITVTKRKPAAKAAMSARQGWRGLGLPKRASKRKCSVVSGNFNLGVPLERAERMRTIRPARVMDFQARASKLGVKITREEAEFLQRRVLENRGRLTDSPTKFTYYRYHRYIRDRNLLELEREGILEAIEQPEGASEATKKLIPIIGIIGTISWAITGTQLAGECGMNFFGCAFVGGVSSLGGGKNCFMSFFFSNSSFVTNV